MTRSRNVALAIVLAFLTPGPADAVPAQLSSYAIVQSDGTLKVQGYTIRLFGIYIPPGERRCEARIRPVRCGSRAAVALRTKVTGFVDCRPQGVYEDGSVAAICYSDAVFRNRGVDLGAWLIEQGLALAGPGAPFEYRALERIAERQGRGVWGFFVDDFDRRRGRFGR